MITVHHLEESRSLRVLWLLEELGVDYEVKYYKRDPATLLAPDALRAVHPLGKSPIIVDGDLVLAETGAIVQYLTSRYGEGRLAPHPNAPDYLRYLYWLHYSEGSAMPPLLFKLVFDRLPQGAGPLLRPVVRRIADTVKARFIVPQLSLHLDYIEAELGKSDWFAGAAFSGADIMMSFPLEAAAGRAGQAGRQPHMSAFLERIHARPAYQRAVKRGDP